MKAPTPTPDDYAGEDYADIGDSLNEVRRSIANKDPKRATAWLLIDIVKAADHPSNDRSRWWGMFAREIHALEDEEFEAWLKENGFHKRVAK